MRIGDLSGRQCRAALRRLVLCMVVVPPMLAGMAVAQQSVIVVGNDRGGYVGARAQEISRIVASGSRVEIRGNICLSACTMYLGAGNVCVTPTTTFGFHGPSANGRPLPPDRFDHWSRVMARYYQEPIREWFMSSARYQQNGYYRISGSQLIRLGYTSC